MLLRWLLHSMCGSVRLGVIVQQMACFCLWSCCPRTVQSRGQRSNFSIGRHISRKLTWDLTPPDHPRVREDRSEGFPRTRITKRSCACDCGRGPVSVGAFFLSFSFFFFLFSFSFFFFLSSSLTQNHALKFIFVGKKRCFRVAREGEGRRGENEKKNVKKKKKKTKELNEKMKNMKK